MQLQLAQAPRTFKKIIPKPVNGGEVRVKISGFIMMGINEMPFEQLLILKKGGPQGYYIKEELF